LLTLIPLAKSSAAELEAPQLVIKNVSDQLKQRMEDKTFASDFVQITEYVNEVIFPIVNFNKISQSVLGPLWRQATPTQKTKFQKEFKLLLVRTYSRAFIEFDEWSIRYLPLKTAAASAKKLTVRTQVLQPGVKPIGVDYRMGLFDGQWQVYDIKIEGISLTTNYRSSFQNEVKRSGSLDSVIDKLAAKNNPSASAEVPG
jgi:phospholipid transport system substrate-binding protein